MRMNFFYGQRGDLIRDRRETHELQKAYAAAYLRYIEDGGVPFASSKDLKKLDPIFNSEEWLDQFDESGESELVRELGKKHVDGYGRSFSLKNEGSYLVIISSGEDGVFNTEDDHEFIMGPANEMK